MRHPMKVRSWLWAGVLALAASSAGADLGELEAQAKKPPKDPEAALELGLKLRRAGSFDNAVRVLRGAAARAKGDTAVALKLAAARSLISASKQKDALRECQGLKATSPSAHDVCVAEAQLLWKRASLALPAAERALKSKSTDYDALVAKGRALRMMSKAEESEEAFRAAIQEDGKRHEAYLFLAELKDIVGKPKEAIEALRKATALAPEEPEPWLELGRLLPAGSEATSALGKAIAIRPKYGAAHARLGEIQLEQGAIADAEKSLTTAIGIQSNQADWHASLAHVLVAKKDHAAALKAVAKALKLVNNHASAKLAEADAIALTGDVDLAIEVYEKAASYARSNPAPLVHAARASLAGNRPTTARAFADRAVQSFPDWRPAWEVLGDVAVATKEKALARSSYQKALAAKQGRADDAELKKKLAKVK